MACFRGSKQAPCIPWACVLLKCQDQHQNASIKSHQCHGNRPLSSVYALLCTTAVSQQSQQVQDIAGLGSNTVPTHQSLLIHAGTDRVSAAHIPHEQSHDERHACLCNVYQAITRRCSIMRYDTTHQLGTNLVHSTWLIRAHQIQFRNKHMYMAQQLCCNQLLLLQW